MSRNDDLTDDKSDRPPRLETVWRSKLTDHGVDDERVRDDIVSDLLARSRLLSPAITRSEFEELVGQQIDALDPTRVSNGDSDDDATILKDTLRDALHHCVDGEYRMPAAVPLSVASESPNKTPDSETASVTSPVNTGTMSGKATGSRRLSLATNFDPETGGAREEHDTSDTPIKKTEPSRDTGEDPQEGYDPARVVEIKRQLQPLVERDENPISSADLVRAVSELERDADLHHDQPKNP